MDADAIIAEIVAAFPSKPVPEVGLYQTHMADALYMRRITEAEHATAPARDGGRTWKEYRDEELRELDAALAHQQVAGFAYFLPAYLCAAVRHVDGEDWWTFVGHANFQLMNRSDYMLMRFARFTPAQRAAAIHYLEFMAAHAEDDESDLARKALERYWKKPAPPDRP